MPRDVPLRRSLLMRLLLVSVLVSICSIAATAWLTVRGTTVAIRQEQGQALADDAMVYDTLLGYAAGHPDWSGAADTVRRLAERVGRPVTLTRRDRTPIAASGPATLPAKPTAVVEPLDVDTTAAGSPSGRIDPRAVGPFRLPAGERVRLRQAAERRARCLRDGFGVTTKILDGPSGRPYVETPSLNQAVAARCDTQVLDAATPTETKALTELTRLVNACLTRRGAPTVRLGLDFTWTPTPGPAGQRGQASRNLARDVPDCIDTSRREQLAPYVAPPALLFVGTPGPGASTIFDLSPGNQARIAGVAALVLLITVTVSIVAGVPLIRPLRALTGAARRMTDGDVTARVHVSRGDEIGGLADAFNAMARRREQLEDLRKAMVSDVAHELRTPLSNIRGWLEATEDGVVALDRSLASSLLEEAHLLQHIVDDLRDLAIADAGELRLRPEPLDAADLISQVATTHHPETDAAVTLTTHAEGDTRLCADPVRLRQAVGNLVSNAVRHTPPSGSVTLSARRDGPHVVIDVTDTGVGIDPADLPLIFERFWRADRSRSRRTGGSGLGLSIARKLAEAHGGTLSATSVPGHGSTFTLRLPAT